MSRTQPLPAAETPLDSQWETATRRTDAGPDSTGAPSATMGAAAASARSLRSAFRHSHHWSHDDWRLALGVAGPATLAVYWYVVLVGEVNRQLAGIKAPRQSVD